MIEVNSVRFSYLRNGHIVLNDCSASFRSQGLFLIKGTNGSGKSTFLDVVTGFKMPLSGTVIINGINVYKNNNSLKAISRIVSYMPASLRFPNTLTVSYILQHYSGPHFFGELCKVLGLEEFKDKKYSELSDGYKTRLALSICLSKGAYIFLDEPLKSQDEDLKRIFPQILNKYTAGRSVVVCSPQAIQGIDWNNCYELRNGRLAEC